MDRKKREAVRKQFTFYESFYTSMEMLDMTSRGRILTAVCEYALYGQEIPLRSDIEWIYFGMVRPVLDTARRKAEAGRRGALVTNEKRWGTGGVAAEEPQDDTFM